MKKRRESRLIVTGQCPICETKRKSWEGHKFRCSYCRADLVVKQNQFLEEPLEEVTESPKYEVVVAHTKSIDINTLLTLSNSPFASFGPIYLIWPTYCCLCLKSVKQSNFYKMSTKLEFGYIENIYSVEYKLKIPYCKDCHHKVKKFFGQREEEGVTVLSGGTASESRLVMKFRNPQYASIFRQANRNQIRQY